MFVLSFGLFLAVIVLNDMVKKTPIKKVCHYCQHSGYDGTYSRHLQNYHKKEWGIRQLVKSLSSEELDEVKTFILEIKKR